MTTTTDWKTSLKQLFAAPTNLQLVAWISVLSLSYLHILNIWLRVYLRIFTQCYIIPTEHYRTILNSSQDECGCKWFQYIIMNLLLMVYVTVIGSIEKYSIIDNPKPIRKILLIGACVLTLLRLYMIGFAHFSGIPECF